MTRTIALPFQPDAVTPAQLAAVSYLLGTPDRPTGCRPTSCAAVPPPLMGSTDRPDSHLGSIHSAQTLARRFDGSVCCAIDRPASG